MAAEVSNDIVAGFEDGTVRLLQYGKSTTNMRPVFLFILLDGAMNSSANQRSFSKYSGLLKIRTPKNQDFCVFAKKDLSDKSGLSPKIATRTSPDFKHTTVSF